ncbi:MAG: M15 family metallopeptidase, partial [Solobacterium sp.]|nr:M15 family metallopeptidase [Solobacterium sp.]
NDGIYLELDSARRSVAAQQRIMDSFTEKYGIDYALKTVAQPGYSEHHTGLALDLYFKLKNEDGTFTDVYYNEDMVQYPELWAKVHAKLADYGFILRYLEGREHITGYGYEPWHIRYVDDVDIAKEIMSKDITFEEYLGAVNSTDVTIDYGNSSIFTQEELEEAVIQIKCKFASFEGYKLHSIRYAGDDASNEDNLKRINETNPDAGYVKVAEFLMDCYDADEDKDNTGYPWWLGRTEDDTWEIVSQGD